MNKIFKVIWDAASQQFVVTSELGKAKGKTKSIKTAKTALATVVAMTGGVYSAQVLAVQASVNSVAYNSNEGLSVSYGIATGNKHAVAIGGDGTDPARAAAAGAIAIGGQANATNTHGVAIGWNSTASGVNSVAYGSLTLANQTNSTAIGTQSKATGINATSVGSQANASASDATAYGANANATGQASTALGRGANASTQGSISIGTSSAAGGGNHATAIGDLTKATGLRTTAVGVQANASTDYTTALGNNATATVAGAVALGSGSVASRASGTAGYDPKTKAASTAGTTTWSANAAAVSIGNGNATTRQLTSVAAGTQDTDAVNVAQLKALAEVVANNTIRYFSVNSTIAGNRDNTGATATNAIAIGPDARGQMESSVAIGHNVTTIMTPAGGLSSAGGGGVAIGKDSSSFVGGVSVGTNATSGMIPHAVSIGYNTTINTAPYIDPDNTQQKIGGIAIGDNVVSKSQSIAIGINATSVGKYNVVMGTDAIASGERDIVIGNGAVSNRQNADSYNIAIGRSATATEVAAGSLAVGMDSQVNATSATAVGRSAHANGLNSAAFGFKAAANGSASTALGELANATGGSTVAIGSRSEAAADNAIAIGTQSDALKGSSIAIGVNSVANAIHGVAMGTQARVYDTAEAGVAIGLTTYVRGTNGVGIGRANNANGTDSIVIGSFSNATGNESIAIGKGHVVAANNAGTFGDPNYILAGADRSYVIGNNNTVNTADTFVLGSNVNRLADGSNNTVGTVANSVYLGNGTEATAGTGVGTKVLDTNQVAGTTTTAGDTGTVTTATVANITYGSFAGATANGVVSVGAAGAERRVQNVAAGEISATSTDAINGSQLYAVAKQAASPLTFTANTNADTDAETLDKTYAAGDGTQQQLGESIAIIGSKTNKTLAENTDAAVDSTYSSKNIQTVVTNNQVQIQMAENPVFNSVQFGSETGPKITNDGNNIKVGDDNGAPVKITNVANGTNANDAVNLQQLNATKVAVVAGDNTAVTSAPNTTTGGTDYTVHADKTVVVPATGSNITVTPATTTNANGTETTTYSLDLDQATKAQIAKEETVSSATPALVTVTTNATKNNTGGNDFVVSVTQATYDADVTKDSGAIKAPTTDGVVTGNQLTNIINEGFWTAQVGGTDLKEVNFGDELNFVNGNGTKAVAKNGGVAYDVNLVSTDNTITFAPGTDGAVDIKVNTSNLPKTVVQAGTGPVAVTGTGSAADPYTVSVNTTTVLPSPDQNTNGSVASVTNSNAVMTAGDVINVVKNAGFKLTASANGGAETGSTIDSEVINPGDTVDMAAGKNLVVKQDASGKITYSTADDVTFNNVTASNLTATGNTTVNNFTVAPNSVVNMGGNTITNVANGTKATDAVNLQQLNATKVVVKEGKNTTVTSAPNATTGGTDYTVNAVDTSASTSLDAASAKYLAVTANGTTEVGNATVTDYKVGLSAEAINKLDNAITAVEDTATVNMTVTDGTLKADVITNDGAGTTVNTTAGGVSFDIKTDGTTVKVGDNNALTVVTGGTEATTSGTTKVSTGSNATDVATIGDLVETINASGFNVKSGGNKAAGDEADATLINPGEEVTFTAGKNLTVKRVGNEFTYATADDVSFNNVTTNNFTVNQGGTVNMGGNTVTNVANGTNANDAVNLQQLNATKVAVVAGDNTAVTSAPNTTTGGTDYTVHADKTVVEAATGSKVTVTPTTTTNANGTQTTTYSLDLDQATKDQIAKEETVSTGTPDLVTVTTNATKNATGGNDFVVNVTKGTFNNPTTTGELAEGNTGVATVKDVVDAVNKGFLTTKVNGTQVEQVGFGDDINFVDGKGTTARISGQNITYDVNLISSDNSISITDGANGAKDLTVNTGTSTVGGDGKAITTDADEVANLGDVMNTINNVSWSVNSVAAGGENTYKVTDTSKISAGDKLNINAGKNIAISGEGDTLNIATAENVTFNNVTASNLTVGPVTINKDGINAGDTKITNVANGTNANDAVNLQQLNATKVAVVAGDNTAVTSAANTTTGGTDYTVHADKTVVEAATGSKVTVTPTTTTNANGTETTTYSLDLDQATKDQIAKEETVSSGTPALVTVTTNATKNATGGNDFVVNVTKGTFEATPTTGTDAGKLVAPTTDGVATVSDVVTAINASGFNVKSGGNKATGDEADATLINPGEEITYTAGKNLTVKRVGNEFTYATADDVSFNNVTTNNFTVNQGGTVNMGGNTVTNVANGTNANDAVNLQQLNASKVAVKDGTYTTAVGTPNATSGGTDYVVNVNTAQFGSTTNGSLVPAGTNGVATVNDVVTAVNAGYWTTKVNGSNVDQINFGDAVNFVNGTGTTARADGTNITFDIKADGQTIAVDPTTGNLTVQTTTLTNKPATDDRAGEVVLPVDNYKLVTAKTVADAINNSGWSAIASSTGTGTTSGTVSKEFIQPGEVVTFRAGNNLNVDQDQNVFTYSLQENITVNNVTAGNVTVGDVTITEDGIDAGNTTITNVAPGTNGTDAVNLNQLNASTAANAWKITGNNDATTATTVGNQTVSFNNGTGTVAKVVGTNVTFDLNLTSANNTVSVTNNTDGSVNLDVNTSALVGNLGNNANGNVTVPAGEGSKLVNQTTVATAINNSGFTVKANGDAGELVNPGEIVEFKNGQNIKITRDGSNFTIATADDVSFNNVTASNLTVGPVTVNKDGINAGGTKITNVAPGTDGTDAVNVNQLNDQISNVTTKGLNFAGNTGATVHKNLGETLNIEGTLAAGAEASSKNVRVDSDGSKLIVKIAENPVFNSVKFGDTGPSITNNGNNIKVVGTDGTSPVQIQNVANGTAPTDAVNLSQLNASTAASKTEVTSNDKSVTVAQTTGSNGQTIYDLSVKTDGKTISNGSNGLEVKTGDTDVTGGKAVVTGGDVNNGLIATVGDVVNTINNVSWSVAADTVTGTNGVNEYTANDASKISAGDTVTTKAGKNIKISGSGDTLEIHTVDDAQFDSVQFGDNNGPVIKADASNNISVGKSDGSPTKIVNLAAGEADTDAVNVSQLKDAIANVGQSKVVAGKNTSVNSTTVGNTTTYTVNAVDTSASTSADTASSKFLTVTANGTTAVGDATVTDYKVGLTEAALNVLNNAVVKVEDTNTVNLTKTGDTIKADVIAVNGKGTTANVTTAGLAFDVNFGNMSTNSNGVVEGDLTPNTVASTQDVINAINGSGWKTTNTDGTVAVVNPGDTVNYVNGTHTVANVNTKDGTTTVSYDVKTASVTVNDNGTVDTPTENGLVDANTLTNTVNNVSWNVNSTKVEGSVKSSVKGDTTASKVKAGDTVNVNAGNNIEITRKGNTVAVATSMTPTFDSVQVGGETGPVISSDDEGNVKIAKADGKSPAKITNVAAGNAPNDAVNVSQLKGVANHLSNKIDNVDKRASRGIAIAGAIGMLPQPHISGKSMFATSTTNYRGEQAVAVGYSRLSDNGKHIIKLSGSSNLAGKKDAMVGASYGYQW